MHMFLSFYCSIIIIEFSDFQAGDLLQSAGRFHKLDETAVFGAAC